MTTFNQMVVGYLIPMGITLFTFRKEPWENLKVIILIALCPGLNLVGFMFSLVVGGRELNKRGYLPLSDD